jgi:hypothetical protein
MGDYEKEEWVELYRAALLELEHARMAGRIGDARTAIAARIEALCGLPGLQTQSDNAVRGGFAIDMVWPLEGQRFQVSEKESARLASAPVSLDKNPSAKGGTCHDFGLTLHVKPVPVMQYYFSLRCTTTGCVQRASVQIRLQEWPRSSVG